MENYYYDTIAADDGFRLILLQPSADVESPIRCELKTTTLREYDNSILHYYIALSYVWGDVNDKRTILVNGNQLEITTNLDSALRHIRDSKSALYVWADGICINQSDKEERRDQVQLMGLIYRIARHTIIFLGESTPASVRLMDALESHTSSLNAIKFIPGFMSNMSQIFVSASGSKDARGTLLDAAGASESLIKMDIRESLQSNMQGWEWFRRVWVLQEVVLSGDPWIQTGSQRIRWDAFSSGVLSIGDIDHRSGIQSLLFDMQTARSNSGICYLRTQSLEVAVANKLLELLHARRGLGVTDPRDMIFGHLGLLGDVPHDSKLQAIIQSGYDQSVSDLFTRITTYMIYVRGGLSILTDVEDTPLSQRDNLPTWVPDWKAPKISAPSPVKDTYSEVGVILFDFLPVLGCLGASADIIQVVFETKPPKVDLKTLYHESLGLTGLFDSNTSNKSEIFDLVLHQVYSETFNLLSKWFEDQGFELSSLLSSQHPNLPHVSFYDRIFSFMKAPTRPLKPLSHCTNPAGIYDCLSEMIISMTDWDGLGTFPGKKIAITEGNRLIFVPMFAEAGDSIYHLGMSRNLYALRTAEGGCYTDVETQMANRFMDLKASYLHGELDDPDQSWAGVNDEGEWVIPRLPTHEEDFRQGIDDAVEFNLRGEAGRKRDELAMTNSLLHHLNDPQVKHFNFIGECFRDDRDASVGVSYTYTEAPEQSIIALY